MPGTEAHIGLGMAQAHSGEAEAALKAIDFARQLNPRGPFKPIMVAFQAVAHLCAGRDEEAAELAARSIGERHDNMVAHLVLASALGHLDRVDEARDSVIKVMERFPNFTLAKHERRVPMIGNAENRARYIEGLRISGLPE